MTVTPTVADATSTVTVNGTTVASGAASQAITLSVGNNTINVVVTAQDSTTTKIYTITVTRARLEQCRPEQPDGEPGLSHTCLCSQARRVTRTPWQTVLPA